MCMTGMYGRHMTGDGQVGHAFISYAPGDAAAADRLQQELEASGIQVWRDINVLPGDDWRTQIRHAVTNDALAFVACFSRGSLSAITSRQNEELNLAVKQMPLRRPDVPWLIPVRFDDCEIPDWDIGDGRTMRAIRPADLFGERADSETERVVSSIQRILGCAREQTDTGRGFSAREDESAAGSEHLNDEKEADGKEASAFKSTCHEEALTGVGIRRRASSYGPLRRFISIRTGRPRGPVVIAAFLVLFLGAALGYIAWRPARHTPPVPPRTSPVPTTGMRAPTGLESAWQDPGSKAVAGVAYSPGGRVLAVGDTHGSTYLWAEKATNGTLKTAALRKPH